MQPCNLYLFGNFLLMFTFFTMSDGCPSTEELRNFSDILKLETLQKIDASHYFSILKYVGFL